MAITGTWSFGPLISVLTFMAITIAIPCLLLAKNAFVKLVKSQLRCIVSLSNELAIYRDHLRVKLWAIALVSVKT
jgi:hypothetical protein